MRVASTSDAYLDHATRFVHGYYTRRGSELRFEISLENAARHTMVGSRAFTGAPLAAMTAAAHTIDASARDFSTGREDAVDAWGHRDFETAVARDPNFDTAWLAWVETLLQQRDTAPNQKQVIWSSISDSW